MSEVQGVAYTVFNEHQAFKLLIADKDAMQSCRVYTGDVKNRPIL